VIIKVNMNDTSIDEKQPAFLDRPDGATIAYHAHPGKSPGVIFLGGFMSDMTGTKATALEQACRNAGRAFVRFDYFGHGQSSGAFVDGTIGRWKDDAVSVLDELTTGPQVLVGSSMGGWIMLLAALARKERIAGLVGIAPAPDFTRSLMWEGFSDEIRDILTRDGVYQEPSEYSDEPYTIALNLIEEGDNHQILEDGIDLTCPVRILQGMQDPDVPWQHALKLIDALASDDVTLNLSKTGDHRLSEVGDIERLTSTVEKLCQQVSA
jgi:pimeloyl-ACP methyl ester carboxylesterase